jgi:quercetin dioxygenase-like cupin family protein
MKKLYVALALVCASAVSAHAHPGHEPHKKQTATQKRLVTAQGTALAGALAQFKGPMDKPVGVSVRDAANIDLGSEIAGMGKRQMRARIFTIAAGGSVPIHPHNDRPGHAYILSGEITEYRNDAPQAIIRKPGDVAVEKEGVLHAWFNHTGGPVEVLVVDIFNP